MVIKQTDTNSQNFVNSMKIFNMIMNIPTKFRKITYNRSSTTKNKTFSQPKKVRRRSESLNHVFFGR